MDGGGYRREQSLAAPGGYEYGSPAGKEGGGQLPRRSTFFWISTRARTHLMPGFPSPPSRPRCNGRGSAQRLLRSISPLNAKGSDGWILMSRVLAHAVPDPESLVRE